MEPEGSTTAYSHFRKGVTTGPAGVCINKYPQCAPDSAHTGSRPHRRPAAVKPSIPFLDHHTRQNCWPTCIVIRSPAAAACCGTKKAFPGRISIYPDTSWSIASTHAVPPTAEVVSPQQLNICTPVRRTSINYILINFPRTALTIPALPSPLHDPPSMLHYLLALYGAYIRILVLSNQIFHNLLFHATPQRCGPPPRANWRLVLRRPKRPIAPRAHTPRLAGSGTATANSLLWSSTAQAS